MNTIPQPSPYHQTLRTRKKLWRPDMVDMVHILRQGIAELTGPETGDKTLPTLFRQLMVETGLDEDETTTCLINNLLTDPVLDCFFSGRLNREDNGTGKILTDLLLDALGPELVPLDGFYSRVRDKCRTMDNSVARLEYLTEIFDEYYRLAFPLVAQQHGIFHTPVAIVDFILHSVNFLLTEHGGRSLGDPDLHILDPFLGTGIFPVRLIEGEFLDDPDGIATLADRLQGMEIVGLSTRVAGLQVERALEEKTGRPLPWRNLRNRDTLASHRKHDLLSCLRTDPALPRPAVIIGNPPWSLAQRHADLEHRKSTYPELDDRIRTTYCPVDRGTNKVPLFDSYVRALRWSSDRLLPRGIIGFVINSAFLLGKSVSGLRRALVEEFSHIYIVDLRGDIRKNVHFDWSNGEGENIFGRKVMTGSALLFLVRKGEGNHEPARIFHYRLGSNLTTGEKLDCLAGWKSIADLDWTELHPDANHDWFNPRSTQFSDFMPVAPRRSTADEPTWFDSTREPVRPASEGWSINACPKVARANMKFFIDSYNERARGGKTSSRPIKWTDELRLRAGAGMEVDPDLGRVRKVMLRPFVKRYQYVHPDLPFGRGPDVDMDSGQANGNDASRVIVPFNGGSELGFSTLMMDVPPVLADGGANYCLPKSHYPPPHRTIPDAR